MCFMHEVECGMGGGRRRDRGYIQQIEMEWYPAQAGHIEFPDKCLSTEDYTHDLVAHSVTSYIFGEMCRCDWDDDEYVLPLLAFHNHTDTQTHIKETHLNAVTWQVVNTLLNFTSESKVAKKNSRGGPNFWIRMDGVLFCELVKLYRTIENKLWKLCWDILYAESV